LVFDEKALFISSQKGLDTRDVLRLQADVTVKKAGKTKRIVKIKDKK